MKKILTLGLSAFLLFIAGCGSESESDAAACRFSVQQNLDQGNYAAVIAELTNPASACYAAYSGNEWQIDLGAAYMGSAGLSVSDIITLIGVQDDTNTSSYEAFIDGVSSKQSATALESLGNASDAYTAALGLTNCTDPNLTTSQKDICLYIGLAETMLATTTVSYLLDDIAALFDDVNTTAQDAAKEDMEASMCALQYMNDGSLCSGASSVTASDVTFTYTDASTRVFSDVVVTMNTSSNVYYRLGTETATIPGGTTIVTDGYCSNDFSNPSDTRDAVLSPYACPLNQNPAVADQNVSTLLVDTLNSGLDAVSGALGGDPTLQADIDAYKAEIDTDASGDVTLTEIQDYLNSL